MRIYIRGLLVRRAMRDSRRRQVLDKLTRAETQGGRYALEPPDDSL